MLTQQRQPQWHALFVVVTLCCCLASKPQCVQYVYICLLIFLANHAHFIYMHVVSLTLDSSIWLLVIAYAPSGNLRLSQCKVIDSFYAYNYINAICLIWHIAKQSLDIAPSIGSIAVILIRITSFNEAIILESSSNSTLMLKNHGMSFWWCKMHVHCYGHCNEFSLEIPDCLPLKIASLCIGSAF